MLEFLSNLINLIQSWFNSNKIKQDEQIKTETAREEVIVQTVKAKSVEKQIETIEQANAALKQSQSKHKFEDEKNAKKPINEIIDDQFGSDW